MLGMLAACLGCGLTDQRLQAEAGAADEQPEANVPRRLQQKITKRVRFLEKVATSRAAPRLEVKGGTQKKKRRRGAVSERLKNFSGLAASLEEAAKEASAPRSTCWLHARCVMQAPDQQYAGPCNH